MLQEHKLNFQLWSSTLLIYYFEAISLLFDRAMTSFSGLLIEYEPAKQRTTFPVCIYRSYSHRKQKCNKIVAKMIEKSISKVVVGGCRWFYMVLGGFRSFLVLVLTSVQRHFLYCNPIHKLIRQSNPQIDHKQN